MTFLGRKSSKRLDLFETKSFLKNVFLEKLPRPLIFKNTFLRPMQARDEILKKALIGTARSAQSFGSALGQIAAEFNLPDTHDPAKKLLALAAAESRIRRAGYLFLKKEDVAPPVFFGEKWPVCPPAAARSLRQILNGPFAPALPEYLHLAVFFKKSLPPASLPTILDLFFEKKLDWPTLTDSIGARGKWLAAQHPDWKKLLENNEPTEANWETGTLADRLHFLKKMRSENPALALDFLKKTWDDEPWEHRAQFITALETGLSPDDEVFLETAIFDKRKEVRRQAIRLAAKNRGSRFARQLFEFAADSIIFDKKSDKLEAVLNKNSLNSSVLHLLENTATASKTTVADATILAEIAALVPPENWENHFSESPEKLVRMFDAAGFLPPILEAVFSNKTENWQLALLHFWAADPDRPAWASPVWAQILADLPPNFFDPEIEKVFSYENFFLENNAPLLVALGRTEHFWSAGFTVAFFKHLHFWLDHQSELAWNAYYLDDFLKKIIWRADAGSLGQLREIWQKPPRYSPISPHNIDRLWAVLEFRNRMRAGFFVNH